MLVNVILVIALQVNESRKEEGVEPERRRQRIALHNSLVAQAFLTKV